MEQSGGKKKMNVSFLLRNVCLAVFSHLVVSDSL